MKRADVKVGEAYGLRRTRLADPVRCVVTGEAVEEKLSTWSRRMRPPVRIPIRFDSGDTGRAEARELQPWAEAEAEMLAHRAKTNAATAAREARRAQWQDTPARLKAAGVRASLSWEGDRLDLTVTDPSQARRVLAALEPAAAGEETTT